MDLKDEKEFKKNLENAKVMGECFDNLCSTLKSQNKEIEFFSIGNCICDKITEIYEYYKLKDVSYCDSGVKDAVLYYFNLLARYARDVLSKYCILCKSDNLNKNVMSQKIVEEYNNICKKIKNFSMDNVDKAINIYIDDLFKFDWYQKNANSSIDSFNYELQKLGISKIIKYRDDEKYINNEVDFSDDPELKPSWTDRDMLEYQWENISNLSSNFLDICQGIEKYESHAVNLLPIGIYMHNKTGDIYRHFKEKKVSYRESVVNQLISSYFMMLASMAYEELKKYWRINTNRFSIFLHRYGKKFGMKHLKNYNNICNMILNFSFEDDVDIAINEVIDDRIEFGIMVDSINEDIAICNEELQMLGIDKKIDSRDIEKTKDSMIEEQDFLSNLIMDNDVLDTLSSFFTEEQTKYFMQIKSVLDNQELNKKNDDKVLSLKK